MLTAPAPSPPTDLRFALEEIRAAIAAEGPDKGLAGKVQALILRLVETLLAIVADFRAGRLVAPGACLPSPSAQSSPASGEAGMDAQRAEAREVAGGGCAAGDVSLVNRWILAPAIASGRLVAGMMGFAGRGADPCAMGEESQPDTRSAETRTDAGLLPASGTRDPDPIFAGKDQGSSLRRSPRARPAGKREGKLHPERTRIAPPLALARRTAASKPPRSPRFPIQAARGATAARAKKGFFKNRGFGRQEELRPFRYDIVI